MGIRDLFRRIKKPAKKAKKKVVSKKETAKKKKIVKAVPHLNKKECPECGSTNVVISKITGNTICKDCGAIFAGPTPEVETKISEVKKKF